MNDPPTLSPLRDTLSALRNPDLMGKLIFIILSGLITIASMATTAGCSARDAAIEHVSFPAMDSAWPGVRNDAEIGGMDAAPLDTFELALDERDRIGLVSQWPPIKTAATDGIGAQIADGSIGEGPAASKIERVNNFDEAINQLRPLAPP